ncbi:MAG: homogentisate 1,2-dioxygenase, partial [Steroidobacteraceae bacterium]
MTAALAYQRGFGNLFATEALPGALPAQNSPQRCSYDLYPEQISGTAFTAPRDSNRHTWLYRIRPAAAQRPFARIDSGRIAGDFSGLTASPNPLRWSPPPLPGAPADFIEGLATLAGNADPYEQSGCAVHLYAANRPMAGRAFYDADGELLIVP